MTLGSSVSRDYANTAVHVKWKIAQLNYWNTLDSIILIFKICIFITFESSKFSKKSCNGVSRTLTKEKAIKKKLTF